jgi:hypothetical protein
VLCPAFWLKIELRRVLRNIIGVDRCCELEVEEMMIADVCLATAAGWLSGQQSCKAAVSMVDGGVHGATLTHLCYVTGQQPQLSEVHEHVQFVSGAKKNWTCSWTSDNCGCCPVT